MLVVECGILSIERFRTHRTYRFCPELCTLLWCIVRRGKEGTRTKESIEYKWAKTSKSNVVESSSRIIIMTNQRVTIVKLSQYHAVAVWLWWNSSVKNKPLNSTTTYSLFNYLLSSSSPKKKHFMMEFQPICSHFPIDWWLLFLWVSMIETFL